MATKKRGTASASGPIARAEDRRNLVKYLESALQLALALPDDEEATLEFLQGDLKKAASIVDSRLDAIALAEDG